MTKVSSDTRVRLLAIDPCTTGFGFAVLEGRNRLLDWGVTKVWGKSREAFLARLEPLCLKYQPGGLVTEELSERHGARRRMMVRAAHDYAKDRGIQMYQIARAQIRETFEGRNKEEIAAAITDVFPELRSRLPRHRKPWMSEDERMNLFDAVVLIVTALR